MTARRRILILLALCAAACAPLPQAADAPAQSEERRMLALVNQERERRSLRPFQWSGELARLARAHAEDMRGMGTATHHSSRDHADFAARLARTELKASAAAENVAYAPDVERAHRGLMESPGHRRNLLDRGLTAIGIGIVREEGGRAIYVVQDFAAPIADLTESQAASRVRAALAEARRRRNLPPLEEREALAVRLAAHLDRLIAADSVTVDPSLVPGPAWVIAYTSPSPGDLPDEVGGRLKTADGFALAARFGRTARYPFGTYWVLLALTGVR